MDIKGRATRLGYGQSHIGPSPACRVRYLSLNTFTPPSDAPLRYATLVKDRSRAPARFGSI
jgi:hypothetical protein